MKLLTNVMFLTDITVVLFLIINICSVTLNKNKIKSNTIKKIITYPKWYLVVTLLAIIIFGFEVAQLVLKLMLGMNCVTTIMLMVISVGYIASMVEFTAKENSSKN